MTVDGESAGQDRGLSLPFTFGFLVLTQCLQSFPAGVSFHTSISYTYRPVQPISPRGPALAALSWLYPPLSDPPTAWTAPQRRLWISCHGHPFRLSACPQNCLSAFHGKVMHTYSAGKGSRLALDAAARACRVAGQHAEVSLTKRVFLLNRSQRSSRHRDLTI